MKKIVHSVSSVGVEVEAGERKWPEMENQSISVGEEGVEEVRCEIRRRKVRF